MESVALEMRIWGECAHCERHEHPAVLRVAWYEDHCACQDDLPYHVEWLPPEHASAVVHSQEGGQTGELRPLGVPMYPEQHGVRQRHPHRPDEDTDEGVPAHLCWSEEAEVGACGCGKGYKA